MCHLPHLLTLFISSQALLRLACARVAPPKTHALDAKALDLIIIVSARCAGFWLCNVAFIPG